MLSNQGLLPFAENQTIEYWDLPSLHIKDEYCHQSKFTVVT